MLSDLPNVKFDIHEKVALSNEDLSFKNLTSIDLQPVVKIYDNKKEVEITGYLVLSGEFIVKNQYFEDQLDQFDALHYDTLLNNEYKVDSFQHQIPVSIQIDNNRVENISNVIVQVEEFDYEILSNQEIELIAQIKIFGVSAESSKEIPIETDADEYYDEKTFKEYEKYDILDRQHENEYLKENISLEDNNEVDTKTDEKNEDLHQVIENKDTKVKPKLGITAKPDKNDPNYLNPIYSLLKKGQQEIKEIVQRDFDEIIPSIENTIMEEKPLITETGDNTEEKNTETDEGFAIVKSSSKVNKDNILYGLLKEDEVQSYKLKLYFVQRDDTIEKIAEKYEINSEDIIKRNNITNQELLLGQLLYLPVKR